MTVSRSRSSKVADFDIKRVCNFLLVTNSNLCLNVYLALFQMMQDFY